MAELACSTETLDGVTVFAVAGEAGVAACPELEFAVNTLITAHPTRVVIDLSALTFMSSLGIGQLMLLAQHVTKPGGSVAVAVPPGDLRETLERCRLHQLAPFFADRDQALAHLSAA